MADKTLEGSYKGPCVKRAITHRNIKFLVVSWAKRNGFLGGLNLGWFINPENAIKGPESATTEESSGAGQIQLLAKKCQLPANLLGEPCPIWAQHPPNPYVAPPENSHELGGGAPPKIKTK